MRAAQRFDRSNRLIRSTTLALFGYLNRWNDSMATELEELPSKVARKTIGAGGWQAGKYG